MNFNLFKAFTLFGIISTWATQALEDGKVTLVEAVDLVTKLCVVLGVNPELDIPGANPTEQETLDPEGSEDVAPGTAEEQAQEERPPHKPIGGYSP